MLLNLELMLTTQCNFQCKYCYEKKKPIASMSWEVISQIANFIEQRKEQIIISFWGGEPSLEIHKILFFIDYFEKNELVSFRMFTNGTNLPLDFLLKVKKLGKRFELQISCDFLPNGERINFLGEDTYSSVLNKIYELHENEVPFTTKSTLNEYSIERLFECYSEWKKFSNACPGHGSLNITFDTFCKWDIWNSLEFEEVLINFKENLQKILSDVIKCKEIQPNLFSKNKAICAAGGDLLGIDVDGSVYVCHAAIFSSNKEDFLLGHINNFNKFKDLRHIFNCLCEMESEDCRRCETVFCHRCSVHKYELSSKKNFFDRFRDYSCLGRYCRIMNIVSVYALAYNRLMEK